MIVLNILFDYFFQFHSRSFFRTKRRLSIAPLPVLRLNDKEMMSADFENHSMISNQNSISSMNSLASLLKEKMQVSNFLHFTRFLYFLQANHAIILYFAKYSMHNEVECVCVTNAH